jgi:hypothetical protein
VSGNLLQTFYFMFKTNAQQAKKDIGEVGKASEDVEKKLKKTRDETGELGKAFTSTFENGLRALAAYGSFQAMKSGIVTAQQFNRDLTIQSKLWGQNANEINAWGKAVKQAGGDQQAFLGWYQNIRQNNAAIGVKTMAPNEMMRHINQQIQGLSPEAKQMIFGKYGINDIGHQAELDVTPEELERSIEKQAELTKNTVAASAASQQFGKSWDNLTSSLEKFWNTVNTSILPPLAKLIDGLATFFNWVANDGDASVAVFAAMGVAALMFTAAIPAMVAGFGAISAAALAAMPAVAALTAGIIAAASIPGAVSDMVNGTRESWIGRTSRKIAGWIDPDVANMYSGKQITGGMSVSGSGGSGSTMDYLMNKHGLSATHAAGIVANMQAESGGNVSARGDGGRAHGLFQWHPDRRAGIKAGTGIDVSNATKEQQLDAMMWELNQRGELGGLLSQTTAHGAGAYFSQKFERPANGMYEAMKRGQMAMEIAGQTPFASNSNVGGQSGGQGVSIGKIDVNTQATDADGIARDIGSALQKHIGGVYSQNNDAVAY